MYNRKKIKEMLQESRVNFYDEESFIEDAKRYIAAIREGRMICSIPWVSRSGDSRRIKFLECSYSPRIKKFRYLNFFSFFKALGYDTHGYMKDSFLISGCGMDMVFHTNYSIIRQLGKFGFLSKENTAYLSQKTPSVI